MFPATLLTHAPRPPPLPRVPSSQHSTPSELGQERPLGERTVGIHCLHPTDCKTEASRTLGLGVEFEAPILVTSAGHHRALSVGGRVSGFLGRGTMAP